MERKKMFLIIAGVLILISIFTITSKNGTQKNKKMNHKQRLQIVLKQKYPSAQRVEAKIEAKDYEGALKDCQELKAMEGQNKDWFLLNMCADAKAKLGQYEEAVKDYDEALKNDPNNKMLQYEKEKISKMPHRR